MMLITIPMKKRVTILIAQILICTVCFSQREIIDSLKKVLPSLRDSARVDCLNEISELYIGLPDWFSKTPTKNKFDSAEFFNCEAFKEAKRINYNYGLAKALSLEADLRFEG